MPATGPEQALSDADHLGVLQAIWIDQCRAEAHSRYAQAVRDHASPDDAEEILKDTDALWRTVQAAGDEWLTVDEVCAELRIGRRTFERWRTLGVAPRATRPTRNGPLKIKRSWLEEWAEDGAT